MIAGTTRCSPTIMGPTLTMLPEVLELNWKFRGDDMRDYGLTSRVENEKELVLEKIFDAPREKLFEMFTDSKHLENFWGPYGWELSYSSMDFRPGGEWFYGMKYASDDPEMQGVESWGKMEFKEIDQPNRIVYVDYFADKTGEINRELPIARSTMDFIELDENRTILVNRTEYSVEEELLELINRGMREGIAETWDRLSKYIASQK